ncbi:hypothetical protein AS200_14710 [Streptomyces sp. CdTB01]|nr:hypothetical protein AS200_14710 [Streptomyces sp. CdTB01]
MRDALSARGLLFVVGVLALQLGFILSYIGAFHSPTPHRIPVAVVAPASVSARITETLNTLDGDPVKATTAPSEAAARAQVMNRSVDAAFILNPQGTTDRLVVASAGGPALSTVAAQLAQKIESTQQRQVTITDIRPPAAADGRGLSSFYLVIGWMVGGYLVASILGVAIGALPANLPRTAIRLGTLAVYAIASGLGGAIIVDPVLGTLTGHFATLWAIGSLVVFAAAATTMALQILLGTVGIGVAILFFVVLGNPSAGGPYPSMLLPAFWRVIGPALPPGAGTAAVRNTVYFNGSATTGPLWILAAYAAAGLAVSLLAAALLHRRGGSRARAQQLAA